MDRIDIEILLTLRSTIPKDLNGIKMSGTNMPSAFELKNRLSQLQDQNFTQKEGGIYRITHTGKNHFWKKNDEKSNIMRLLQVTKLTDTEMKNITGLDKKIFDDVMLSLLRTNLVLPVKSDDNGLLYELQPEGYERLKLISEPVSHVTQNFITNIDNVQINNSITVFQIKIDELIIKVENNNKLKSNEKTNIISKLRSLKTLLSTAEPYVRPYLIESLSEFFKNPLSSS